MNAIDLDHLLPVAGWPELEYDADNVVLTCYGCNRRKGDRLGLGDVVDIHGMRIIDPSVKCKVHDPILATCPHSGSLK